MTAGWATATLFLANLYAQLPAFADGDRMTTIAILFLLLWFGQIVGNWLLAWTWCSAFALLSLIVGKSAADATFEFGVVLLVGLMATHFQSPLSRRIFGGSKAACILRGTLAGLGCGSGGRKKAAEPVLNFNPQTYKTSPITAHAT